MYKVTFEHYACFGRFEQPSSVCGSIISQSTYFFSLRILASITSVCNGRRLITEELQKKTTANLRPEISECIACSG